MLTGQDTNYYDLAQNLRKRINDLKITIDRQLRSLKALKDRVRDQVVDMQRLEVRRQNKKNNNKDERTLQTSRASMAES